MKKAEKQLHPHNYILSLNKRWLLPLMCSNPAKATYDEWIEKFHTGSDEIGYQKSGLGRVWVAIFRLFFFSYIINLKVTFGLLLL